MKTIEIPHTQSSKNKVLLIYTGGTLGMGYASQSKNLVPFDFSQILDNIPELQNLSCGLKVRAFENPIDSSNVNKNIWIKIAQEILDNYQDFDGFVVLHGTDTMAFSASALSYLLRGINKPVIFTGAQLPIGAIRNDARRNLVTSIEIATSKTLQGRAKVPEVAIFFNEVLLRGNRAKKMESSHFDAFKSENYPPLARVGIQVQYFGNEILPYQSSFLPNMILEMNENVSVLKLFPSIPKNIVETILNTENLEGIVLETYGSGNAPTEKWFVQCLEKAIKNNIHIYNISQCIGGQVQQGRYATSQQLQDIGVISGRDITWEAGITKLMYLLGQNLTHSQVRELLLVSLAGEITEEF